MLMHDQVPTLEGFEVNMANSDYLVTPCDDGSYCCGNGNLAENCCKEKRGVFLENGMAVSRDSNSILSGVAASSSIKAIPSSSLSVALTSLQSFNAPTPIASVSSSSAAKPSPETGTIIGAAIGGAAVLALITGIIVFIWMRRMTYKSRGHETPQVTWDKRDQDHGTRGAMETNTHHEMAAIRPVLELEDFEESQRQVPELENSTRFHRR